MQFIQSLLSRQKEKKRKAKSFAWCRPQMVMSDSISLLLRTYVSRVTVLRFSLHMPTCLWSPSSAISGNIQCQCTLKLQVSLSLHGEQKKLVEKNRMKRVWRPRTPSERTMARSEAPNFSPGVSVIFQTKKTLYVTLSLSLSCSDFGSSNVLEM